MSNRAEDNRTLTAWSGATLQLVEDTARLLFRAKSLQTNVSGVIAESLARFSEAAPTLKQQDWTDMIHLYEKKYKGSQRKQILLNAEGRHYIAAIGDSMLKVSKTWSGFQLIQRHNPVAYSSMPLIVFALLWVQSQHNTK